MFPLGTVKDVSVWFGSGDSEDTGSSILESRLPYEAVRIVVYKTNYLFISS